MSKENTFKRFEVSNSRLHAHAADTSGCNIMTSERRTVAFGSKNLNWDNFSNSVGLFR